MDTTIPRALHLRFVCTAVLFAGLIVAGCGGGIPTYDWPGGTYVDGEWGFAVDVPADGFAVQQLEATTEFGLNNNVRFEAHQADAPNDCWVRVSVTDAPTGDGLGDQILRESLNLQQRLPDGSRVREWGNNRMRVLPTTGDVYTVSYIHIASDRCDVASLAAVEASVRTSAAATSPTAWPPENKSGNVMVDICPPGFFTGVLHGLIVPVRSVVAWFKDDFTVVAPGARLPYKVGMGFGVFFLAVFVLNSRQ